MFRNIESTLVPKSQGWDYIRSQPRQEGVRLLVAPPVLVRNCNFGVKSLFSISEIDKKGSRLEVGFRRVLHLRYIFSPQSCWKVIAFSFLDQTNVPFPSAMMTSAFVFPKIVNHFTTEVGNAEVETFIKAIHSDSSRSSSHERSQFPRSTL